MFQAGQLWLQDDTHGTVQLSHPQTGEIVWGVQVSTRDRGFSFCPSVLHGTMPWTGDRWAVTAFTPRGLQKLEVSDQRQLLHWGFLAPGSPLVTISGNRQPEGRVV